MEGKTFSSESEVYLIEVDHGQDANDVSGFALELCSHCSVKADAPFLFNPNLSQAAFSRDFFAPFSGVSALNNGANGNLSLPTALLSSSINAIAQSTTTTTTTTLFQVSPSSSSSNSSGTSASSQPTATSGGSTPATTTTTAPRTLTSTVKADATLAANPEPATLMLLGTGLAVGVFGRRKVRGRQV